MKYIDADKLIAEIEKRRNNALERQKNLEKIGQVTVLNEMIAFELNKILSFITSLQQEQAEMDLEKEFSKWWKKEHSHNYEVDILYERYSNISLKLARHFYELGLNVRKK